MTLTGSVVGIKTDTLNTIQMSELKIKPNENDNKFAIKYNQKQQHHHELDEKFIYIYRSVVFKLNPFPRCTS